MVNFQKPVLGLLLLLDVPAEPFPRRSRSRIGSLDFPGRIQIMTGGSFAFLDQAKCRYFCPCNRVCAI